MTKRSTAIQAAHDVAVREATVAETSRIREILREGSQVGNPELAEHLALNTLHSAGEARDILRVSAFSMETRRVERGRADEAIYARRLAADRVLGVREAAQRDVESLLEKHAPA